MLVNTQLKGTIQEKKSSLSSHRIVNQEIANREVLCQAVCDKAQELISKTQDKSLQVYVTSINELFRNIKDKSNDLLQKLESAVTAHSKLTEQIKNFSDWLSQQEGKLLSADDVTGEKGVLVRRIETIQLLKDESEKGNSLLDQIKDLFPSVTAATSEAGSKIIESETKSLDLAFQNYLSRIGAAEEKLNNVHKNWKDFDVTFQEITKFCNEQESTFRSHSLYPTLEEKERALKDFMEKSQVVADYEPKVNAFLDKSHDLMRGSSVERTKPLILQLSNRYQLLHVLSKEQVNRYQGLVTDHIQYLADFKTTSAALLKLEESLGAGEDLTSELGALNVDKEKIQQKIASVTNLGEKLYPDTANTGRDSIRLELRLLAERFDKCEGCLSELQKKKVSHNMQLDS